MQRVSPVRIKPTSFDAIEVPEGIDLDLRSVDSIRAALQQLTFIEIKQANQERVRDDFGGFFFALTESEIHAAEQLGERHRVALYNARTGALQMTSVAQLLARATSTTWQVSIQL